MIQKKVKQAIKSVLMWKILNESGLRKLNGSWAEAKHLSIKAVDDGFLVSGTACCGVQDGDEDREYRNSFVDIFVSKEKIEEFI